MRALEKQALEKQALEPLITLTTKEVANILRKSSHWVYEHYRKLAGVKIGGSIIFTEENLKDAISRGQEMEGGSQIPGAEASMPDRNEAQCLKVGKRQEKEIIRREAAERHCLVRFLH